MRRTRPPRPSGLRQVIVAAGGRVNLVAELEDIAPLAVLHTDFTELVYAAGKAQLMRCRGRALGRLCTRPRRPPAGRVPFRKALVRSGRS